MTWIAGKQFTPLENYESEVAQYKAEIEKLKEEIKTLTIQRDTIMSGNHEVLVSKTSELDRIIADQHIIKQTIVNGTTEVSEKIKEENLKLKKLQNSIDAHNNDIESFNKYSENRVSSLLNLEKELKEKEIEDLVKKHKEKLDYKTGMVELNHKKKK